MSLLSRVAPRAGGVAAALFASTLSFVPAHADPINILFVGNSFTYGDAAGGPNLVQPYKANTVTDLNKTGIGGVPALFKAFTVERGLNYNVSLETMGGVGVDWHYMNRLPLINQPWDQVVLQSYSTLDANRPGNPATLIQYSGLLANLLYGQNPNVDIHLDATWSRADLTYKPGGAFYGQSIYAMENIVKAGYAQAQQANPHIDDVIETGQAWARTWETGFADSNPYDGITAGQVDMWAPEGYHASVYGYFMEALMFFGDVTKLDPLSIGYDQVAMDLGITRAQALTLETLASQTLQGVPEPETLALIAAGLIGFAVRGRRGRRTIGSARPA